MLNKSLVLTSSPLDACSQEQQLDCQLCQKLLGYALVTLTLTNDCLILLLSAMSKPMERQCR